MLLDAKKYQIAGSFIYKGNQESRRPRVGRIY